MVIDLAPHEVAAMRRSASLLEAIAESYPVGLERGDLAVTAEVLRKLTEAEDVGV